MTPEQENEAIKETYRCQNGKCQNSAFGADIWCLEHLKEKQKMNRTELIIQISKIILAIIGLGLILNKLQEIIYWLQIK